MPRIVFTKPFSVALEGIHPVTYQPGEREVSATVAASALRCGAAREVAAGKSEEKVASAPGSAEAGGARPASPSGTPKAAAGSKTRAAAKTSAKS